MNTVNIHQKIIQTAETLIQTKGYNAFSYSDIANEVGIKTSSIHYHFPTKADLGAAVVQQHADNLGEKLAAITANADLDCSGKLEVVFDSIFELTYFSAEKMCLGGMLASEVLTLPEVIQAEVRIFFKKIELWLKDLLEIGIANNEFKLRQDPSREATFMLMLLEGGLLLARLYHDENRLWMVKQEVLSRLVK